MDEFETTKSCWGVTFWAVAMFAGTVAFAAALTDEGGTELAAAPSALVASVGN